MPDALGPLELTTRFSAISTGARPGKLARIRRQLTPAEAIGAAMAHLRYIDRPGAALERAAAGIVDFTTGSLASTSHEIHAALRVRIRQRTECGGEVGARIAEKMIVSLPNGWPAEARQEALELIVEHLAPPGSEAMAYAVSHRDKPGNAHLHVLALDGLESLEAARARRPEAKRVRRRQVIRLGDLDRPKELRAEIAAILNGIAERCDLQRVEWRSFEARGIDQEATVHEGPRRRAIAAKEGRLTPRAQDNKRRRQGRSEMALEGFWVSGGTPLDLDSLERPQAALESRSKAPDGFFAASKGTPLELGDFEPPQEAPVSSSTAPQYRPSSPPLQATSGAPAGRVATRDTTLLAIARAAARQRIDALRRRLWHRIRTRDDPER